MRYIEKNRWDIFYLLIFAAVVWKEFLYSTMFSVEILNDKERYFYGILMLYVLMKLVFSGLFTRQEQIISFGIIILFSVAGFSSGYLEIIQLVLLIIGARSVDFRKILRVYLLVSTIMLVASIVASAIGIIPDIITYTPRKLNGGVRHSFGILYPTDFSAHVFYIIMALSSLIGCISIDMPKNRQVAARLLCCVLAILAGAFVFYQCLAFTSFACLMGFVILIFFFGIVDLTADNLFIRCIRYIVTLIPVELAILYLTLSKFYVAGISTWDKINIALSERLQVSHRAFEMYNIKILGQFVEEQGWGGRLDTSGITELEYFFLDDSYMRIILEYGVLVFVVIMAIYVAIINKVIEAKHGIVLAALVAVAVHCFMEHHLMEVAYNPFLFLIGAKLVEKRPKNTDNIRRKV